MTLLGSEIWKRAAAYGSLQHNRLQSYNRQPQIPEKKTEHAYNN